MKKVLLILFLCLIFFCGFQYRMIGNLKAERDSYKTNTETLLQECHTYKVRDSLSAAKVGTLELSIKEFERYRAEDAGIINDLKAKNRDLERLSKTQAQTIIELRAQPKDTVVMIDSVKVDAKAVECGDKWYSFQGIVTDDDFWGQVSVNEELLVSETVRYKKILWWKTKRIKDRELNIASKNPYTKINNIEFLMIRK